MGIAIASVAIIVIIAVLAKQYYLAKHYFCISPGGLFRPAVWVPKKQFLSMLNNEKIKLLRSVNNE